MVGLTEVMGCSQWDLRGILREEVKFHTLEGLAVVASPFPKRSAGSLQFTVFVSKEGGLPIKSSSLK